MIQVYSDELMKIWEEEYEPFFVEQQLQLLQVATHQKDRDKENTLQRMMKFVQKLCAKYLVNIHGPPRSEMPPFEGESLLSSSGSASQNPGSDASSFSQALGLPEREFFSHLQRHMPTITDSPKEVGSHLDVPTRLSSYFDDVEGGTEALPELPSISSIVENIPRSHFCLLLLPFIWTSREENPLFIHFLPFHPLATDLLKLQSLESLPLSLEQCSSSERRILIDILAIDGPATMEENTPEDPSEKYFHDGKKFSFLECIAAFTCWCFHQGNLSSSILLVQILSFYRQRGAFERALTIDPQSVNAIKQIFPFVCSWDRLSAFTKPPASVLKKDPKAPVSEEEEVLHMELVTNLMAASGQPEGVCRLALERHHWDPNIAVCWLLDNMELAVNIFAEQAGKEKSSDSDALVAWKRKARAIRQSFISKELQSRGAFVKLFETLPSSSFYRLMKNKPIDENVEEDEETRSWTLLEGMLDTLPLLVWSHVDRLIIELDFPLKTADFDYVQVEKYILDESPISLPLLVSVGLDHVNQLQKESSSEGVLIPRHTYSVCIVLRILTRFVLSNFPFFLSLKESERDQMERMSIQKMAELIQGFVEICGEICPQAFPESIKSFRDGDTINLQRFLKTATGRLSDESTGKLSSSTQGGDVHHIREAIEMCVDLWMLGFELFYPSVSSRVRLLNEWIYGEFRNTLSFGSRVLLFVAMTVTRIDHSLLGDWYPNLSIDDQTESKKSSLPPDEAKSPNGSDQEDVDLSVGLKEHSPPMPSQAEKQRVLFEDKFKHFREFVNESGDDNLLRLLENPANDLSFPTLALSILFGLTQNTLSTLDRISDMDEETFAEGSQPTWECFPQYQESIKQVLIQGILHSYRHHRYLDLPPVEGFPAPLPIRPTCSCRSFDLFLVVYYIFTSCSRILQRALDLLKIHGPSIVSDLTAILNDSIVRSLLPDLALGICVLPNFDAEFAEVLLIRLDQLLRVVVSYGKAFEDAQANTPAAKIPILVTSNEEKGKKNTKKPRPVEITLSETLMKQLRMIQFFYYLPGALFLFL